MSNANNKGNLAQTQHGNAKTIKSKQGKKSKDTILLSSNNDPSKYDYIRPNTLSISDSTQLTTKVGQLIRHRLMDVIHDGKLDFESILAKNPKQKSKKMASQYIMNLRNVLDALVAQEVDCLNIIRTTLIELKIVELTDNEELYSAFDDMLYDLIYELKAQACIV